MVEETIEVLGERDYCSIGRFDSCRNGTSTIHFLKENIIIIQGGLHHGGLTPALAPRMPVITEDEGKSRP